MIGAFLIIIAFLLAVEVKAKMVSTGFEAGLLGAINTIEREFRQAFPLVAWLFLSLITRTGNKLE